MSNFIPNSFQTPNVYIDAVMPLLLPHEFVVLSYAVRRIFGFNKRQDRIALSQFTDGTVSGDGHNYDYGTGLSVGTVRKAIDVLIGFKLLIKVADNDTRRNEGALYELQLDQDAVDWDGLKLRAAKRSSNMVAKMEKVRNAKPAMPQTPLCGTVPPPLCGTVPPPLCGIATQNTVEIQGNPAFAPTSGAAPAPTSGAAPDIKNGNGKAARQPSKKDLATSELENEFSKVSNIALPPRQTEKQKRAAAIRWWNPLWQIYQAANCDTGMAATLIRQAITQMRKDGMTVAAPASIEAVVISIAASKKSSSESVGNVYV